MDSKENVTQVWEKIEAVLRHSVGENDRIPWQSLIAAYIEKRLSWDELTFPILQVWEDRSPPREIKEKLKSPQPAPSLKGITRTTVLAEIAQAHAAQDPEVVQFREAALGGTLLKWHEIPPWITKEQEKERALPSVFLSAVPLPVGNDWRVTHRGIVPDPPLVVGEEHPAGSTRVELLTYATPESSWERVVPVGHGGVLASLHYLSTKLARQYHWQPPQATVFVLTGLIPVLPAIGVAWDSVHFQTQAGSVTALSRIVLTIDPTLSPKEVHSCFQSIRQRFLGAKWRDLNESQLKLARFALHCGDEETWPQRMDSWNRNAKIRKERYDNLSHFKRDCQHVMKKLLEPVQLAKNFFPQSEEHNAKTPRKS
jgi:hypothetical protein